MDKASAQAEVSRIIKKFHRDLVYTAPELHEFKFEHLIADIQAIIHSIRNVN